MMKFPTRTRVSAGLGAILITGIASAARAARAQDLPVKPIPAPADGQKIVLRETDPASLHHSRLADRGADMSEVIRTDVDGDGRPDIIECWWNGHRARWFDENHDMTAIDMRGDMSDDRVQIDRDGDGYYDGPGDMNVKWVAVDGDGRPDYEIVAMNPNVTQKGLYAGDSHWMIFPDVDHDGVNAYIDWTNFNFDNWRITGKGDFSPDYNGNAAFLKQHMPPAFISDPRYNWENPFLFFDTDGDGCTEMSIRLLDDPIKNSGGEAAGEHFDGKIEEAFVSYDLDNDSQKGNEMDYDMTLKLEARKPGSAWDYSRFHNKVPNMKAPAWELPYFRYTNWMTIDEFIYVPHDKAYDELFRHRYDNAYLTFDEDDDDHRWERVELYYPGDPYSTKRWTRGHEGGGLDGHPQSDSLGDRGEWDLDFSGKGKLYIGPWDRKIHLVGAETGAWTVDEHAEYWGSRPVAGDSSPTMAEKVGEVVQYKDTDNNGFFDQITFDYNGDKVVDLTVNLLDDATPENPHPDVQPTIDPASEHWEGMHNLFTRISDDAFQDALVMYRAAWKKSITTKEIDDLAIAASVGERYDHAYWLKEKLYRLFDARLAANPTYRTARADLKRYFFTGQIGKVADLIDNIAL